MKLAKPAIIVHYWNNMDSLSVKTKLSAIEISTARSEITYARDRNTLE